jgi:hypothetical protein
MDSSAFEKIVRNTGFNPRDKIKTRLGNILVADRYYNVHVEFPEPHYQVLYAIERAGMDLGQILYFKFGENTHRSRMNAVKGVASQWLKDNQEVGRYS